MIGTWQQILDRELESLAVQNEFMLIPQVYVAGAALTAASRIFKGRRDLFMMLERELIGAVENRPSLLLYGARRSGKTSVLRQLPVHLGPDYVPVEIDLQSAATASDPARLLGYIAGRIVDNVANFRHLHLSVIEPAALETDPYIAFLDWLSLVENQVCNKLILLNLDEYERLEEMIIDRRLDRRVFHWLRGIIQQHPGVVVMLSGSHMPSELGPLWSDTLVNVRTLYVGPLEEDEACDLIERPVPDFALKYTPEAVKQILFASGRQPFLIQATCRDLVNILNGKKRLYADVAEVEHALASCLETGQTYFSELWQGLDSDDAQRQVMAILAQAGGLLSETDMVRKVEGTPLIHTLRRLERRDIIEKTDSGYRFRADLVRRWVLQNTD